MDILYLMLARPNLKIENNNYDMFLHDMWFPYEHVYVKDSCLHVLLDFKYEIYFQVQNQNWNFI